MNGEEYLYEKCSSPLIRCRRRSGRTTAIIKGISEAGGGTIVVSREDTVRSIKRVVKELGISNVKVISLEYEHTGEDLGITLLDNSLIDELVTSFGNQLAKVNIINNQLKVNNIIIDKYREEFNSPSYKFYRKCVSILKRILLIK
jgi:uncharacterized Fe-S center protein